MCNVASFAMFLIQTILSTLSLVSLAFGRPTLEQRDLVCNGRAELCDRSYGNVTFLTSHDSFAYSTNPLELARTQSLDLTAQMNLGVRALQAQSHMKDGVLHFCHTSCLLFDGGSVLSYLQTVKRFMDSHPNDVFTFIFTNPERLSPKNIWDPVFQQSGLASMAYVPPRRPLKASEWPTLRQLIQTGKRLVVFMDYGTNTADVSYILPEFDHIWEPPFSSTDPSFPCRVDRMNGPLSSQDHMFMINHNLNARVFPSLRARSPLPAPTAAPGWFDDLASAIHNAGGMINSGIQQAGSMIQSGASSVGGAIHSAISSAINQGQDAANSVLVPDYLSTPTTNSMRSILADSNGCAPFSGGKATNFVMLDFVEVGEGMRAVDRLNGFL